MACNKDQSAYYISFDNQFDAYEWHKNLPKNTPNHPFLKEGGSIVPWPIYRNYCKNLNLVYEVEEKIKSMGNHSKTMYMAILNDIVNAHSTDVLIVQEFNVCHASPIDRLCAALLTLEGVKE